MMKSVSTGVAALIAYGCMLDNTSALKINQKAAEQPKPEVIELAQSQFSINPYLQSLDSNTPLYVTFDNEADQQVELFWLDFQGVERSYGTIAPGASLDINTFATHPWKAYGINDHSVEIELEGDEVFVPYAGDEGRIIHIDEGDNVRSYNGAAVDVTFKNEASQEVELLWHDYEGLLQSYGSIAPNQTKHLRTYATHPWSAYGNTDAEREMSVDNKSVYIPVVGDAHRTIVIEEFESKNASSGLITLYFENESGQDVELYWHNYNGDEVSYGRIAAGETRTQQTYATHPWSVVGLSTDYTHCELVVDGADIYVPTKQDHNKHIYIGKDYCY